MEHNSITYCFIMIAFTLGNTFSITYENNSPCSFIPLISSLYKQSKGFGLSIERECITNKIKYTVYKAHISQHSSCFSELVKICKFEAKRKII